jgi:hypothetical protein
MNPTSLFLSKKLVFNGHCLTMKVCFLVGPLVCLLLASPSQGAPLRAASSDESTVFNALDLDQPDLSKVAAALKAGDYDLASHDFSTYLRARKGLIWRAKNTPPAKYNRAVADAAVQGKVQGGLVPLVYAFPGGKVDWHYNATNHTQGQAPNDEWQWQLNRMEFWNDMAGAYAATGDERYPKAFVNQLRSWAKQCPVPDRLEYGGGSAWRTIEAGIRMGYSWPNAFFAFLPSPWLTDADIILYTRLVIDHGRYLRKHPSATGNWVSMELNGLATAGCFFPELREAADWRSFAFKHLAEEIHQQFLPDGGEYELTPGYHLVSLNNVIQAFLVAQRTGRAQELPPDYLGSVEKAYEWGMLLSTPDRSLPKFNDSWPANIPKVLSQAQIDFPHREDFRWFATRGAEGKMPKTTSVFLDWSGYAVMRSGWDTDANYLAFDVGPLGMAHSHQDKLNVVLWAYGRELLFDGGGASYERSKWRSWSISTASHNCVLVDGLGQERTSKSGRSPIERTRDPIFVSQKPIEADWQSTSVMDRATGNYDEEYGPEKQRIATQQRTVIFLKPDVYIVSDVMKPLNDQQHVYQARWNLLTTHTVIDQKTQAVITADAKEPNLAVIPLLPNGLAIQSASAQEEPELLGWNVRKDSSSPHEPATTVLHTIQGVGPKIFLTLLLPIKAGRDLPIESITCTEPIEILFKNGRRIQVSATVDKPLKATESSEANSN